MKYASMLLVLAGAMMGQTPSVTTPAVQVVVPQRTAALAVGTVPTPADMYCSGFISTDKVL